MSEVKKLKDFLYGEGGVGARDFSVYPGVRRASPEEVAGEVNRAIKAISAGDAELVEYPDD